MELKKTWEQFEERVAADEVLRQEYEGDPEGIFLRETGTSLAEFQQQAKQLGDDDLVAVSGGMSLLRRTRCKYCGLETSSRKLREHEPVCSKNPVNK
ncbi:MAG: hypothetical protein M0R49_00365 [Limnochordia bacterium]|jgi:hypothetical protein|nr:hypothetical protein [Limnochordia bacterium]